MASLFLLIGSLVLLPSSATADWVPVGPFGGDARSLVADPANPDRMYLGTRTGQLYETTDGGKSWTRLTGFLAPPNWVVDDLLIEPSESDQARKPRVLNNPAELSQPKVLYAGMWSLGSGGGGVFKSSDGGRSWTELVGMAGQPVRALAMAPSHPRTLIAGSLDGVFRSDDAGEHWRRVSPLGHAEIRNLESVAIDPRNPDIVYIGTWHLPWKTANGGKTWTQIHKGIIDDSDVFSLVVNPSEPNNLYIGACSGIYRSDTAAAEWRKIQGIPSSSRRTHTLVLDPRDPAVVYAGTTEGLFETRDGGQSWTRLTPQTWVINAVVLDPRDSRHFYLAMDHAGVMETQDGGKTFQPANQGFSQRQVSRLLADPSQPGRFYAAVLHDGDFGGVFTTKDNGTSWQQLTAGLGERDVLSLLILTQPAWRLLAGTPDGVFEYSTEQGVWQNRSRWEIPLNRPKGASAAAAAWDLYQRRPGEAIYAATSLGLFESPDGRAWKRLPLASNPGSAYAVAALGEGGRTLVAATGHATMISRDAGRSWAPLDFGAGSQIKVHRLAAHSTNPEVLFVASSLGLFRSTDSGRHWERFGRGLPFSSPILEIVISPENPRQVTVAGVAGIFRSLDGGDRFDRTQETDGPEGLPVRFLAIHTGQSDVVLAASAMNGVFRNGARALPLSQPR
ncbi:MAG: hypothetical protein A3H28_16430 [Acidobacteria bacterium RIFCSPLOWO2_02_FULL_61_28]|nr:MAG: hypothetical protein A3H28_16430 [Acidobacteria bacterium RIFCSPLOWO2_02_FULL_61_28]